MTTSSTSQSPSQHTSVVLFYKYFVDIFSELQQDAEFYTNQLVRHQKDLCARLGLKGRVLLATEGINGTLSGRNNAVIEQYITCMESFAIHFKNEDQLEDKQKQHRQLYTDIDWKKSSVGSTERTPFPDLKIDVVNEIVSSGGVVQVDEIPQLGGKHLSPQEFHEALQQKESNNNVVLVDVRNTYEHDIGHFIHPHTNEPALNPQTTTFANFSNFCVQHADALQDKKVIMYCTGGIRCEKASAMLKKRGVDNVSQLHGGIQRYLEQYPDHGFFKGKNFLFDHRVAITSNNNQEIVGKCVECRTPFDELSGSRICTVCRELVLVCPTCHLKLREYHCQRHAGWKDCYYTFLQVFDEQELQKQLEKLQVHRHHLLNIGGNCKNMRRTLMRQITKVSNHLEQLKLGEVHVDRNAPRRCRYCQKPNLICDGNCWGFWRGNDSSEIEGCET